jgi:hypothetical protein
LAALLEEIRAEAADIRHEIGKVGFPLIGNFLAQVRGSYLFDNFFHPILSRLRALDGHKLLIDAENDWSADFKVHVGRAAFDGRFQYAMKHFHPAEASRSGVGTKELSCRRKKHRTSKFLVEDGRQDYGKRPETKRVGLEFVNGEVNVSAAYARHAATRDGCPEGQAKRATAIWLSRACACLERPVKTIET